MGLAIVEVQDAETVREIVFGLRVASWKSVGVLTDGRFPPDICQDEHDAHALHWAAFDGERLVGAARMCVHDTPQWLAKLTRGPVPSTPLIERRVMVLTLEQLRER